METNKNIDWIGNTQSVMATLNASNHSNKYRAENDYYATPPEAVEELLREEIFKNVWECACGQGHISEVLKQHKIHYLSSDLVNRGYGIQEDFLLRAVLSKKPNGFSHWMNCGIQNRKVFI